MTFFAPESDTAVASVSPFRLATDWLWSGLNLAAEQHPHVVSLKMLTDVGAAQLELLEATMDLMLLPFSGLGGSIVTKAEAEASSAIPDAPPVVDATPLAPPAPEASPEPVAVVASVIANDDVEDVSGLAPALLDKPAGQHDDLLLIKGIGPKLNQLLNNLGVWHFSQIVSWTPAEVAWVNAKIDFPGRVQREGWQAQAAALMTPTKAA